MPAKYQKLVAFVVLGFLLLASLPNAVSADNKILQTLKSAGDPTGYDTTRKTNPIDIVATIVQVFLGVLSVIFLVLMIYAGYLWMTASGSEDKLTKAKHILINATIGLAIILASYALTWFVFEYFKVAGGGMGSGAAETQP